MNGMKRNPQCTCCFTRILLLLVCSMLYIIYCAVISLTVAVSSGVSFPEFSYFAWIASSSLMSCMAMFIPLPLPPLLPTRLPFIQCSLFTRNIPTLLLLLLLTIDFPPHTPLRQPLHHLRDQNRLFPALSLIPGVAQGVEPAKEPEFL